MQALRAAARYFSRVLRLRCACLRHARARHVAAFTPLTRDGKRRCRRWRIEDATLFRARLRYYHSAAERAMVKSAAQRVPYASAAFMLCALRYRRRCRVDALFTVYALLPPMFRDFVPRGSSRR